MRVRMAMMLAVGILIAVSGLVRAQSPGGYDLTWHTIDNGGATLSTSDGYQLGGTILSRVAFWWAGPCPNRPRIISTCPSS